MFYYAHALSGEDVVNELVHLGELLKTLFGEDNSVNFLDGSSSPVLLDSPSS
jgi:hypothetical protein